MSDMAVSHRPTMNLRFVKRDGRYILQQMFLPNNWTTHQDEWRDVPLVELTEAPFIPPGAIRK